MPWLLLALAAGGGYWWWTSQKSGKWLTESRYQDKQGRVWDRDLTADPPAPAGYSDWNRGGGTASVRVATPATNSYDAVGKALDAA